MDLPFTIEWGILMGIKKENEQLHQEKKYQFMKEQLRPDRKKQAALACRRLGALAAAAVLFGGIAGAVFMAVKFQLDSSSQKTLHAVSATPSPAVSTPAPTPVTELPAIRKRLTLSDYSRLSEELAAVGDCLEFSLVGVRSKGDFSDLWRGYADTNRLLFGLIFQETSQHYYLLTVCDTIREQTTVEVQMIDDTMVEGKIVGSDYSLNLAVVSIRKNDLSQ